MQVFSTIVIQFILLLYTTNYVISLKCYQCNSHNDNACNSITDSRERPKECPPHLQASCKTIVQNISFRSMYHSLPYPFWFRSYCNLNIIFCTLFSTLIPSFGLYFSKLLYAVVR
ncbi:unnamed protein product [Schistosoma mattheei]|uniref:Protein quiver n=1 Tax=Schistosoma mattheei TaxID=31246 RepID=A0AA85AU45_9TREM|nr:unnamed protein product [Schistosoma mattheei]